MAEGNTPVKRYNMTARVGKYTDRNNETKFNYATIGKATLRSDESISLEIQTIPVGIDGKPRDGKANLLVNTPKDERGGQSQGSSEPRLSDNGNTDDDLPF